MAATPPMSSVAEKGGVMKRKQLGTAVALAMGLGGLLVMAQSRAYAPVTQAMLENPGRDDWLSWRRTLSSWGYSPLAQINTGNVHRLQLAWSWALERGNSQPAPLVHDGVMFVPQPEGVVHALDAATGDLLWEYRRSFTTSPNVGLPSRMRSLALFGDKVYVTTPDAHIVALDARTGTVVWDETVADAALGYRYTSGPIVARGRIVAGITGCERYKDDVCFVSAHDAGSGRRLWKTGTIARPGEPGGGTWGDLPLKLRAGGDAWIPGSYDPQTNLIYWSTAQAKPWARVSRGTDGDALYTNSTLALDPDTGKIAWYHQFLPGETHDQDEVFENILVDFEGRPSLFKMGKLGILWQLDRRTGDFVAAHDLGFQNLVDVDAKTGKATYRTGMVPRPGEPIEFCPNTQGVRDWRAMAYHPQLQAFFVLARLNCERAVFSVPTEKENVGNFSWYGKPSITGYQSLATLPHPKSPQHAGALIAVSANGAVLWKSPMTTAPLAATLATGGGLVVASDSSRHLYVHEARTGKVLFETRLPSSVLGSPITYAVRGRQFLAIPVGGGSGPRQLNAMFVFALPK
jgi:alcohol dehydrogenase (cytochrome c)